MKEFLKRFLENKNGSMDLFVTVYNTGSRAIEGKAGLGGRFKALDGIQEFRIEANNAACIRFRLKVKDEKRKTSCVSLRMENSSSSRSKQPPFPRQKPERN